MGLTLGQYVVPHQSQPVGFSEAEGLAPPGVSMVNFDFGPEGDLRHNKVNLFAACQDTELEAINSWQIWWLAAGTPHNMTCTPLGIQKSDACTRI